MEYKNILEMDLLPWFATFAVSLLVGLQYGVLIGFLISVIFLLYWSARPGIRVKSGQVIYFVAHVINILTRMHVQKLPFDSFK